MKNNRESAPLVARNIYHLNAVLRGDQKSIHEVARQVYGFSHALYQFDISQFSKFNVDEKVIFSHDSKGSHTNERIVDEIATLLLNKNKKDIRHYEKEMQPDIHFSREFGFIQSLSTPEEKQLESFWFQLFLGRPNLNTLNVQFPINLKRDYYWYLGLLKTIVDFFDPLSIKIFPKFITTMGIPATLGWITYYSKDSQVPTIPDWMEQETYTDKGAIISLVKQDISINKELYQEYKQKLIEINT